MQVDSVILNPIVLAIVVVLSLIVLTFTASLYLATKPVKKYQVKSYSGESFRGKAPRISTGTQLIARWVEHKDMGRKTPLFIFTSILTIVLVGVVAQSMYLISGNTAFFGNPQDNLIFLGVVGAFLGGMMATVATLIIGRFRG